MEIEAKYVSAGKDARALMVEPHSSGGRLKIGQRRSIGARFTVASCKTIWPGK